MAEEEVAAVAVAEAEDSSSPTDNKRKHEDLEPEPPTMASLNSNANESDSIVKGIEAEVVLADDSTSKRPRLEKDPDELVAENGFQKEVDEPVTQDDEQPSVDIDAKSDEAQPLAEEALETLNEEQPSTDIHQTADIQQPFVDDPQLESAQQKPSGGEHQPASGGEQLQEPPAEVPQQEDVPSAEQQPASETQTLSRKMEIPNNKVGVLIGKAGDTIRFLQINSGAKIQITRDADADPYSATRPVELIGTSENINMAEKLIKDVIAEADAGGSPSLVARGFGMVQAAGTVEQVLIQVPNEKVGVIIGKGGETIKNLQTRSGARIQLIPQHLPDGDQSKERTVRVAGDKKQIEMAREMINEVMNQPIRNSPLSGGYKQQAFRPRGPAASAQWGRRGPHSQPTTGFDYQQRGPYPSQNSQYPPQAYGNYPPQQGAPRSNFGSGWEQRPSSTMQQGPTSQSGSYDYYGGQGHHMVDTPTSVPISNPVPAHGPSPYAAPMGPPHSQGNYNYGQPAPYSQTVPPQSYGHGYNEAKYENQAPSQHPYGGSQSGPYPQGSTHPGYAPPQDQYGKPASYGVPPQHGPPSQSYGQPRASQPGDIPYQGSTQPYGQNAVPQQTYPYASSMPMQQQQIYHPYGSASATDGYNQPLPATGSAPVYPQQGGQPVSGYGQQGGPGSAQVVPGSYPSSQPGYTEQPAQNNVGYGYQGGADPSYGSAPPGSAYGAPPAGQAGYAQPAPTQPGYDQSIPHSGGYGNLPGGGAPQPGHPQYDSNQMYGAHR
ncbi:unnamed protein product [Camellia sinensis]|uniref:far upstream element-binding protein 1-like n=1 Tax=Camellia sinensis TaxID=4442 RepID=UPI001036037E|nr:far upstream element-binding protein 1-like [Camellia sinensis]